jgi:hypothetical protein
VIGVEHASSTYEINVGARGVIRFKIGNVMLVMNLIYMVDYVFYGKSFGSLGALHTWLMWETTCNYCTTFLPYLEAATFTILTLFWLLWLVFPLFCSAFGRIVVLVSFLAFSLQVCWLLSIHS